jgi:hypothetical protein
MVESGVYLRIWKEMVLSCLRVDFFSAIRVRKMGET